MKCRNLFSSKSLLIVFNTVFISSGITLLFGGFLTLYDNSHILLSRLLNTPEGSILHPPFYYVALGLLAGGLFMCAGGALGCWASYSRGYFILSIYFLIILVSLVCQCAACVLMVMWPKYLGLEFNNRSTALDILQSNYGTPENEQYTAAIDLAQIKCCGMTDTKNYDTSLWQLRTLGPRNIIVPLTCCVQAKDGSYLDPRPLNLSQCNELSLNTKYRFTQACYPKLEEWYHGQYIIFLATLLLMSLLEFGVLFSVLLACSHLRKYRKKFTKFPKKRGHKNENMFESGVPQKPLTEKYIHPNNYYSPSMRNPNIYHSHSNDIA